MRKWIWYSLANSALGLHIRIFERGNYLPGYIANFRAKSAYKGKSAQ